MVFGKFESGKRLAQLKGMRGKLEVDSMYKWNDGDD